MMDNEVLLIILTLMASYLAGSIPTAYLTGRFIKGIDIRTVGTRNMGAMNTFYEVGFIPGILVLLIDIGKGAAAIALATWLELPLFVQYLAGVIAIAGHSFPVWLKFRGGKGGATLIGILIYLMPWGIPIGLAIFGLLLLLTRFPTFSYSIALLCFPFIAWLIYHDGALVTYSTLILLLPALQYIPRLREIRAKSSGWRTAFIRKNLKDRR
jgi:glycerol-3-phosphate acyltransferase PlsY